MKGKINKYGYLEIFRADRWIEQLCPDGRLEHSPLEHSPTAKCGGWCPLFEELAGDDLMVILGCGNNSRVIFIESDERQKNEKTDV